MNTMEFRIDGKSLAGKGWSLGDRVTLCHLGAGLTFEGFSYPSESEVTIKFSYPLGTKIVESTASDGLPSFDLVDDEPPIITFRIAHA